MYRKSFFEKMKILKSNVAESRNRDAAEFWLRIEKLVLLGRNYSSYKKANDLACFLMQGYKDDLISTKLGISSSAVRWNKKMLSDELYNIFGEDLFSLFDDFIRNRKVIERRIRVAEASIMGSRTVLSDSFPLDVLVLMQESCKNINSEGVVFDLNDCKPELNFLYKHCKDTLLSELALLDKTKLSYIIDIMENRLGSPEDKYMLLELVGYTKEVLKD